MGEYVMSRELAFYVALKCVSIRNPEVIPFLFQAKWHGQDKLREELWLNVSHTDSKRSNAEIVCTSYHTILSVCFDFNSKSPYKKVILHLLGQGFWGGMFRPTYANLWLDLNQPRHNCGIVISPVPFAEDGKPKIPNVPCLRQVIEYLIDNMFRKFSNQEFLDIIVKRINETGVLNASASEIFLHLCKLRIIATDDEKFYYLNMDRKIFNEIFSQIV